MDVVDASNLQRQILHNTDRIGERKVDSAKKTLTLINPDVNVVTYDVRLGADNVLDIIDGYDVIVDGTDNFPTRYLVNDASLLKRIPVVHGSIFRFEGQVTVFNPYEGPCYRCLLPEPPPAELAPSCSEAGVLGVLPGIVGSLQAVEAIKVLLGIGDTLAGPAAGLRRPRAELPHLQGPPRPGLPGLRPRRRRDRDRRVRRPVHAPRDRGARPADQPGASSPRMIADGGRHVGHLGVRLRPAEVPGPAPVEPDGAEADALTARMSAGRESPTIQPSRPTPHRRAASTKIPGSGFHEPTRADTQTASTSSPEAVPPRACAPGSCGPLVTTATFQPADRSRRSASRESAGKSKAAG